MDKRGVSVPDHSTVLTCLSRELPLPLPTPPFRPVKLGTARRSNSHRGNRRHPARGTDELSPDGVDDAAVIYGRDTLKIHGFLIWWRRPAGRTLFIMRKGAARWGGRRTCGGLGGPDQAAGSKSVVPPPTPPGPSVVPLFKLLHPLQRASRLNSSYTGAKKNFHHVKIFSGLVCFLHPWKA